MLKIGDKIVCKRDKFFIRTGDKRVDYFYGKEYEIRGISNYTSDLDDKFWYYMTGDDVNVNRGFIHYTENYFGFTNYHIYDFFYTKQEYRKLKLEKLC
jgi:hypothetical protein